MAGTMTMNGSNIGFVDATGFRRTAYGIGTTGHAPRHPAPEYGNDRDETAQARLEAVLSRADSIESLI